MTLAQDMNCEPHEREWSGHPVDKGLRDEWLERMNGLSYLLPYSSCEGHCRPTGGGQEDHAHIWFALEDAVFLARLVPVWKEHEPDFQSLARRFFPADEALLVFSLDEKFSGGHALRLHLESTVSRRTEEMPDSVVQWFENTTRSLPVFEEAFLRMVSEGEMPGEPQVPIAQGVKDYLAGLDPLTVITLGELYRQVCPQNPDAARAALQAVALGTPVANRARPPKYYAIRLVLPLHHADAVEQVLLSLRGVSRKHIEYDASQENTRAVKSALSRRYSQETVDYWFRSAQYRSVDLIRTSMKRARERTGGCCALCQAVNALRKNRDLDPIPETFPTRVCHVVSRNSVFWKHLARTAAQLRQEVFSAEGVETLKSFLINDPLHSSPDYMMSLCQTHDRLLQNALRQHASGTRTDHTQLPLL